MRNQQQQQQQNIHEKNIQVTSHKTGRHDLMSSTASVREPPKMKSMTRSNTLLPSALRSALNGVRNNFQLGKLGKSTSNINRDLPQAPFDLLSLSPPDLPLHKRKRLSSPPINLSHHTELSSPKRPRPVSSPIRTSPFRQLPISPDEQKAARKRRDLSTPKPLNEVVHRLTYSQFVEALLQIARGLFYDRLKDRHPLLALDADSELQVVSDEFVIQTCVKCLWQHFSRVLAQKNIGAISSAFQAAFTHVWRKDGCPEYLTAEQYMPAPTVMHRVKKQTSQNEPVRKEVVRGRGDRQMRCVVFLSRLQNIIFPHLILSTSVAAMIHNRPPEEQVALAWFALKDLLKKGEQDDGKKRRKSDETVESGDEEVEEENAVTAQERIQHAATTINNSIKMYLARKELRNRILAVTVFARRASSNNEFLCRFNENGPVQWIEGGSIPRYSIHLFEERMAELGFQWLRDLREDSEPGAYSPLGNFLTFLRKPFSRRELVEYVESRFPLHKDITHRFCLMGSLQSVSVSQASTFLRRVRELERQCVNSSLPAFLSSEIEVIHNRVAGVMSVVNQGGTVAPTARTLFYPLLKRIFNEIFIRQHILEHFCVEYWNKLPELIQSYDMSDDEESALVAEHISMPSNKRCCVIM
eukprot:TRINITY_DN969_c0_g1_i2.p1 TRINITY_DN969_c0_g1~~TRINITY_DN969_c0_g1_i2.p1  ORF type:complete len:728 (+),score=213.23 TRINITY_DN969_c0_g1_i2:267-2186(+)